MVKSNGKTPKLGCPYVKSATKSCGSRETEGNNGLGGGTGKAARMLRGHVKLSGSGSAEEDSKAATRNPGVWKERS